MTVLQSSPAPRRFRGRRAYIALAALVPGLSALGCRAPSSGTVPPGAVSPAVTDSAARDTSATVDIVFGPLEAMLPLLRVTLDDGERVLTVRAADLQRVEGDNAWRTSLLWQAPDTLRVRVAIVAGAEDRDTLAAAATSMPLWRGAGYVIRVRITDFRPVGFTVDSVVAAPFRSGAAPRPSDSLFVSWGGYCVKGPCPVL